MRILSLFAIFLSLLCSSCAVVTNTIYDLPGGKQDFGSGVDAVTPSSNDDESE